jgi:hypothetical protein
MLGAYYGGALPDVSGPGYLVQIDFEAHRHAYGTHEAWRPTWGIRDTCVFG